MDDYKPYEDYFDGSHGISELLKSNHYDNLWPESVDGKWKVHDIKEYQRLEIVGPADYYCRIKYDMKSESYQSEKLYCSCEKPYNPDLKMIQCERCYEWYHINCIGMTEGEVESTGDYICDPCRNIETTKHNNLVTTS
uniref:PHD-type domain-containing protein n=1 Tax=Kalanchoe fedtschenkoi TaxID=63787 RepID=A0A7N0TTS9_KALFE